MKYDRLVVDPFEGFGDDVPSAGEVAGRSAARIALGLDGVDRRGIQEANDRISPLVVERFAGSEPVEE